MEEHRNMADQAPRRPLWVKLSLLLVIALVLAFVGLSLARLGGDHGPGRHLPGAGAGATRPAPTVTESEVGKASPGYGLKP